MAELDGSETQVAQQTSTPTVLAKHPVAESLRAELLKLAQDGDPKHNGALTAEVLARIMRVAKTGRDLLVSLNISGSNLANLVRRRRGPIYSQLGGADEDDGLDDGIGQTAGGPLAWSSPQENFGMTALRELIAGAQKHFSGKNTSPKDLVEALLVARKEGLTDVVKELETQLGLNKPILPVLPAPVKPVAESQLVV